PTDAPRTLKLDLPAAAKTATTIKPPPPPPTSAPLVTKPKDAKVLEFTGDKGSTGKPTTVIPKKDTPPPPPTKKDSSPPQKKDAAPMDKKGKDKDKKQAAVSVPANRLASKTASPVAHQIKISTSLPPS